MVLIPFFIPISTVILLIDVSFVQLVTSLAPESGSIFGAHNYDDTPFVPIGVQTPFHPVAIDYSTARSDFNPTEDGFARLSNPFEYQSPVRTLDSAKTVETVRISEVS